MRSILTLLLPVIFSGGVFADEVVWNKDHGLDLWKAKANAVSVYADGVLKISEIKEDHQLISPVIQLDPAQYNAVSITYRVKEIGRSRGQLFFAGPDGKFNGKNFWGIPPLIADFEWHTITLGEKNLRDPESWAQCGTVIRLRLDPYDAAGGYLEISEIKFFRQKSQPAAKRKPIPRYQRVLDEPEWPKLVSEYQTFAPPVLYGSYFQGGMLRSPLDGKSAVKSFKVLRRIDCKSKPTAAYLQFTADDGARAFINGECVGQSSNWRQVTRAAVDKHLEPGSNVWAFEYSNAGGAGGVLGELFVQYEDGSSEKFHTDEQFVGVDTADENWNKADFQIAEPLDLIRQAPAPAAPWQGVVLPYYDYGKPQKLLSSAMDRTEASAGKTVRLTYSFQGKMPQVPFSAEIVLERDGRTLWRETRTIESSHVKAGDDGTWQLTLDYPLPEYISGGKTALSLNSGSIFFQSGKTNRIDFTLCQADRIEGYPSPPEVSVGKIGKHPRVILNGNDFYPLWGAVRSNKRPDGLPRHSDGPLNVVTVYNNYREWWPEPDKFVPDNFDYCAELYRRHAPDAYFVWDLTLYPPKSWAERYPDEMCRDNTGAVNESGRLCYSFASQQALDDMRWAVAQAITYLENSPYANRIIGYRICSGHTIEWLGWNAKRGRAVDFSPAAQRGFKEFAQEHYPQLTDFTIPSPEERAELDDGELLWDAAKHLRATAYNDFYSNAVAHMIIELAREARKHLKSPKLIGTYYGYTMTLNSSGRGQMRAHYALKRLLDAKCVDFLMSPQTYTLRKVGDTAMDMKPFASMQHHNIIPVIENDTRTHNGPYANNIYQCVNESQTIAVMRRDMGIALCRLLPAYYYALVLGTEFDFPAMRGEMAAVRTVGEHIIGKAEHHAEVALVVSEESIKASPVLQNLGCADGYITQKYDKDGNPVKFPIGKVALNGESMEQNYNRYARMGASSDYLLAEDLPDMQNDDYKLYIFINLFHYDEKFLKKVRELQQRDCTLLWVYAPGYHYHGVGSLENMRILTGFEFTKSPEPLLPQVTLNDGRKMGTPSRRVAPIFQVKPAEDVTVLGRYEDGSVGLAAKKTGKATNIFCGAYQFDMPFLLELLKKSGVHIYTESTDIVETNTHLLMLHARFGGKKEITLPRRTTVLDVYGRQIIGKDIDSFSFEAPLHSTSLFYFGDDAEVLLEKLKRDL